MIRRKPSCSSPSRFSWGDEGVLEGDGRGVRRVPAELVELGRGHPLAGIDDEEAQAVVPARGRRLDRGDVEARAHAVGDVGLLAVDHEAALHARGPGRDRCDVGAGPGLGDGQRGDRRAGDGGHEVAALLVLGAELPQRRGGDADVRADARREPARAAARQLLGEDRVVQVVAALPAVLLGVLQAEEADGRELGEDLVGEPARLLPLGRVGTKLVGDEAPDRVAQRLVLVGEGRVGRHPGRPYCNSESAASS